MTLIVWGKLSEMKSHQDGYYQITWNNVGKDREVVQTFLVKYKISKPL